MDLQQVEQIYDALPLNSREFGKNQPSKKQSVYNTMKFAILSLLAAVAACNGQTNQTRPSAGSNMKVTGKWCGTETANSLFGSFETSTVLDIEDYYIYQGVTADGNGWYKHTFGSSTLYMYHDTDCNGPSQDDDGQ